MGLIRSWWETPSIHWGWLKGERSMRRRWWSRGTHRGSFTWHNESDPAESPHHCWCFSCPDTPFPLSYSTIKSQSGNISFVKRGWHQGLYVLDRPTDHIWDQWNAAVSTTLTHQSIGGGPHLNTLNLAGAGSSRSRYTTRPLASSRRERSPSRLTALVDRRPRLTAGVGDLLGVWPSWNVDVNQPEVTWASCQCACESKINVNIYSVGRKSAPRTQREPLIPSSLPAALQLILLLPFWLKVCINTKGKPLSHPGPNCWCEQWSHWKMKESPKDLQLNRKHWEEYQ